MNQIITEVEIPVEAKGEVGPETTPTPVMVCSIEDIPKAKPLDKSAEVGPTPKLACIRGIKVRGLLTETTEVSEPTPTVGLTP